MNSLIIIGAIVVAVALGAFMIFGGGGQHPTTTVQASNAVTITLTEYAFNPNHVVMNHGRVKLTIVNAGKVIHEFIIHDPVTNQDIGTVPFLKPGATQDLWVDLVAMRRYEIYDSTYRQKGMNGAVTAH
jgi:uncharacterized cupredoxin-like copper-binding protein